MQPTTIILIRHGQTDWNVAGRWQGHEDVDLNEVGQAQATALAQRLASWPIAAIYASDLKRAAVTAATLGMQLGLTPILDASWRERDVGAFQGLTTPELSVKFADAVAQMRHGTMNPPDGESHLDVHARVTAAYHRLLERHRGEMIAVVSHGGTLSVLLSFLLGLPANQRGRFSLRGNTGLSIVEVDETGAHVICLNDTAHLE